MINDFKPSQKLEHVSMILFNKDGSEIKNPKEDVNTFSQFFTSNGPMAVEANSFNCDCPNSSPCLHFLFLYPETEQSNCHSKLI